MSQFHEEGTFLLAAERSADALERRLRASSAHVKVFRVSRDELEALSASFSKAVAVARVYHLAAAMPKDEAA